MLHWLKNALLFKSIGLGLDSWIKSERHRAGLQELGRHSLQQFQVGKKARQPIRSALKTEQNLSSKRWWTAGPIDVL